MTTPQKRTAAPFEVENPTAAFQKLEKFTRKVLAVPKSKIDAYRTPAAPRKKRAN